MVNDHRQAEALGQDKLHKITKPLNTVSHLPPPQGRGRHYHPLPLTNNFCITGAHHHQWLDY